MKLETINRKLLYASFLIYIAILFWIVVLKYSNYDNIVGIIAYVYKNNLKERFLSQFSYKFDFVSAFKDLSNWINIIIFIPLGLYMPLLFKKYNFLRDVLITVFSVTLVEVWQLISALGLMSLLDLINNTLGFVIGSLLFLLFRFFKHEKAVNIINIFAIICGTPLLIFAISVTIINFDLYRYFQWFGIYNVGALIDEEGAPVIDVSHIFFF